MMLDTGFRSVWPIQYPAPFALFDLHLDGGLLRFAPQLFVCDKFWPPNVQDVSQASLGECL